MLQRQKKRRSVLQACELGNKLKNAKKIVIGGERMNVPKKETKLKKILRDRGINNLLLIKWESTLEK